MNEIQKSALIGMVLGDAYLQSTSAKSARIRLEQSLKQHEYLVWKAGFFPEFFLGEPTILERYSRVYKKTYSYCRLQSKSSQEIGTYRRIFYNDKGRKMIPSEITELLVNPLSLCVWYLDDGYYYRRDRVLYIYLPNYSIKEFELLILSMKENFGLEPKLKRKKLGWCFVFSVLQSRELIRIIAPFVPDCMNYKIGL